MQYRPDIDGLRALAVSSVILHHADLGILPGGFLGVDIFFVISGYLITKIIYSDMQTGQFSFADFYRRRALRLLPILLLVIFVFLPIFWVVMLPHQMVDFARSIPGAILFFSNIFFWQETGYFERASDMKPLLHTWSLAVEEQFYIIFPLMLIIFHRLGVRFVLMAMTATAIASLALSEYASYTSPLANFYLLPSRMWEILIGAAVALWFKPDRIPRTGLLQAAGLLLIGYALVAFDETMQLPSIYTLVPVIGAALVLIGAQNTSAIFGLLTLSAFVWIGKISYSAYLWHQPTFVLYKLVADTDAVGAAALLLIPAIFGLSFLSWKFVEVFFRYRFAPHSFGPILAMVGAAAAISILSLWIVNTDALEDRRLTQTQKHILYYETDFRDDVKYPCLLDLHEDFDELNADQCLGENVSAVWGDSHATALSVGWRTLDEGVGIYAKSACPPVINVNDERCASFAANVLQDIQDRGITNVSLHANWRLYDAAALAQLEHTIADLKQVGVEHTSIIGGVPQFAPTLPIRLLEASMSLTQKQALKSYSVEDLRAQDAKIRAIADRSGAQFIDLIGTFCDAEDACLAIVEVDRASLEAFEDLGAPSVIDVGFAPLVYDYGHLSIGGSLYVARFIEENLDYMHKRAD